MSSRRARGAVLAAIVLAVLTLVVPPSVHVRSYHAQIAGAIGSAMGRKVTVGDVVLRVLPQPGFDLDNVTIADDPAFSAEPMITAGQVTASLRLSSLWRGRLEIAKLSFQEPSINLVRSADGRWNVEALLARVSQVPAAPTARSRPEARPRFPYIEADAAQINLRLGDAKKAYALREADFALWLASEDLWDFRLEAVPVRTDTSLSDTGTVRLTGEFHRAQDLRETPFKVHLDWRQAQLGQVTKLLAGRDRGWRGGLNLSADLTGNLAVLTASARASIDDFRRYDIASSDSVRLETTCLASYRAAREELSGVECHLPLGSGDVALRGGVTGLFTGRVYDLNLAATDLPGPALFALARHIKKDLPADLSGTADFDAVFTLRTPPASLAPAPQIVWEGAGSVDQLAIQSSVLPGPRAIGEVSFKMQSQPAAPAGRRAPRGRISVPQPASARVQFAPFHLPLGASAPATAEGTISATDYGFSIRGGAALAELLAVSRAAGLRTPALAVKGTATIDARIAGQWAGFAPPVVTGSARLQNVVGRIHGVNAPVRIESGTLALTQDEIVLEPFSGAIDGEPLDGSVTLQRGCDPLSACPVRFQLHTTALRTDDLNRWLNPRFQDTSWLPFFSGGSTTVARLDATGQLSVDTLWLKSVPASRVVAGVRISGERADLRIQQAGVFGGQYSGEWHADFAGAQPSWRGGGSLQHAQVPQVAAALRGNWGTGAISGEFQAGMSGATAGEMLASLRASADFDWRQGALRHIALADSPLVIRDFTGHLTLAGGLIEITQSRLASPTGVYRVSGTASFVPLVELKFAREGGSTYMVSGSLERPRVVATPAPPEKQAALER